MKRFAPLVGHHVKVAGRRGPSRILTAALAVAVFVTMLAFGCAASASAVTFSRLSHATVSAAAPKIYLQQSGARSKTLRSVALPSKWYLTWTFDCGAKKGTFLLTSTRQGSKSSVDVNSAKGQTGLGGGGQRPFARAGTYKFAVATICSWKVTASSAPLPAAK